MAQQENTVCPESRNVVGKPRVPILVMPEPFQFPLIGIEKKAHGVFLRLQTPPIGPLPIFARVTYRWKELLSPVLSGFKLSCNFSFCYGLELNLVAYCKVVSVYKKDLKSWHMWL